MQAYINKYCSWQTHLQAYQCCWVFLELELHELWWPKMSEFGRIRLKYWPESAKMGQYLLRSGSTLFPSPNDSSLSWPTHAEHRLLAQGARPTVLTSIQFEKKVIYFKAMDVFLRMLRTQKCDVESWLARIAHILLLLVSRVWRRPSLNSESICAWIAFRKALDLLTINKQRLNIYQDIEKPTGLLPPPERLTYLWFVARCALTSPRRNTVTLPESSTNPNSPSKTTL